MYEPEKEEKQTNKKTDKKEPPKKTAENYVKELNKLISKEETGMKRELFQKHFNIQRPIFMLKYLYRTNFKKKNNDLVNLIKSGLSNLKDEIEEMSEN